MKVVTVVGARPQFIKAWPVSRALESAGHDHVLVHTGQHYDYLMSRVFFEELGLREPDRNLEIGSGGHGAQTGRMLERLEDALLELSPDWVLVYGDTNTTLAASLAACKLQLPLAHVEAGLRSFNRSMPEEHNRVLSDHCADALFCPTETAVANLAREGITRGVHLVGDVMFDAVLHFGALARARSTVLGDLALEPREYHLATVHRAYNTDDAATLDRILRAVDAIGEPVIFPLHPRTRQRLNGRAGGHGALDLRNVRLIDPVGYLDMLMLEQHARSILTDSGGVQKEAYFFSVPCVTLRPETEWVETVSVGWNVLVGSDPDAVVNAARSARRHSAPHPDLFGDGNAGVRIARVLGGWRV